jgi:lactate dehydrogenase-like 2-hydroxyacid dehydrogenase
MKQGVKNMAFGLAGMLCGAVSSGIRMNSIVEKKVTETEKFRIMYQLMEHWMRIKQRKGSLAEYFEAYGYKRIAIYGMAEIGYILLKELKETDIEVIYGIDKNPNISSTVRVISPESELPEVDAIIVTAIAYYDEIEELLRKKSDIKIISLEDVVYEIA